MVTIMGIGLIVLQAIDGLLSMWAVHHGCTEINPLMAGVVGTWGGPALKIIPAIAAVICVSYIARRFSKAKICIIGGLIAADLFLTAIIISNLVELF